MRTAPKWEQEIGILYYLTDREGTGGRIKERPEDFLVEEEGPLGRAQVLKLQNREAPEEPEGEGNVLWCVLEKRDWDTVEAVRKIARALGIDIRRISFAGTKDKRALTAQWISMEGVRWRDVRGIRVKDIALHSPVYRRKRIRLGDLYGNWFRIVVRNARGLWIPEKFPNYFGHQRFGSYRFVSHKVGKALLEGNFEEAVRIYLTETTPWEPEETRNARMRLAEEWDLKKALEYFPKRLRIERRILRAIARGASYERAIRSLHRRTISLFIHAYQAYLFNLILSRRMVVGLEPRDGDLLADGVPTGLLPGFRAELADGVQGEIEREVLEEQGVDLNSFKRWKRFGAEGGRRKLLEQPRNPEIHGNTLAFFLPKNTYATALLREIIKPKSPEGFLFTTVRSHEDDGCEHQVRIS